MIKSMFPILFVEAIEPCLPFWVDRLGFTPIVEVPAGDRLGYVMLESNGVIVAYQTFASLEEDLGAHNLTAGGAIYIDVDDLDAVEKALTGVPIAIPRRTTFYGATEIWVREPAGHLVGFALHDK